MEVCIDAYYTLRKISECLKIPTVFFLIFLLRPLYRIAKDRIALYILFSKCSANILCLFSQCVYEILLPLLMVQNQIITTIYPYVIHGLLFVNFVHILEMALNRFFAIFLPFSYSRIWSKKNIQIFAIFVWIVGLILGWLFVLSTYNNYYIYKIVNLTNWVQLLVGAISGTIYIAMLLKFAHEYVFKRTSISSAENLEKDRFSLSMICFISVLPNPMSRFLQFFRGDCTTVFGVTKEMCTILFLILNQCTEEIALILFCKDFRVLIRKQMKRKKLTTVATTIVTPIGQTQIVKEYNDGSRRT